MFEHVKVLVEHGACDYCIKSPGYKTSSLYIASQNGDVKMVDYLLKHGADPSIQLGNMFFVKQLLYSFEECESGIFGFNSPEYSHSRLECLKLILTHLSRYAPQNLILQLEKIFSTASVVIDSRESSSLHIPAESKAWFSKFSSANAVERIKDPEINKEETDSEYDRISFSWQGYFLK